LTIIPKEYKGLLPSDCPKASPQLLSHLIALERAGDKAGAVSLLEGLVVSPKETAELAWTLYLNSAFNSAKLLLEALGEAVPLPLAFAHAHILLVGGDAAFAEKLALSCQAQRDVKVHVPALRAALEHCFSDSFRQIVGNRDTERAERLEALYRSVAPWLDEEGSEGKALRLSDTLLAVSSGRKPCLFATTDKNATTQSLALLNDDAQTITKIEPFLSQERNVILDAGANAGAFSFMAASKFPSSRILAFEPGKAAFACLRHNTRHLQGVEAFELGLGDRDHKPVLHSSIVGSMGGTIARAGINGADGETIDIRNASTAMAELGVTGIDILKLDTEGCECAILSRLGDLAGQSRVIFLEYHSEDDRRQLDDMLSATHHAFSGRILHPHRGELCYLRRDLAQPWDVFRIDPIEMPQA